jgi:acylphosphatase
MVGKHIFVSGDVQGVGFRYFTTYQAQQFGIVGWVRNVEDGRVEALAFGTHDQMEQFLSAIRKGPSKGNVEDVIIKDVVMKHSFKDFVIRHDGGPLWPE